MVGPIPPRDCCAATRTQSLKKKSIEIVVRAPTTAQSPDSKPPKKTATRNCVRSAKKRRCGCLIFFIHRPNPNYFKRKVNRDTANKRFFLVQRGRDWRRLLSSITRNKRTHMTPAATAEATYSPVVRANIAILPHSEADHRT